MGGAIDERCQRESEQADKDNAAKAVEAMMWDGVDKTPDKVAMDHDDSQITLDMPGPHAQDIGDNQETTPYPEDMSVFT